MSQQAYPPLPNHNQLPSFANVSGYAHAYQDSGARAADPYPSPAHDHVLAPAHAQPHAKGGTPSRNDNGGARTNRLRKACDSCSLRKVKCDEAGPPCRACAALEIPCTYERPSRRRGPPNKHAEAIKRQRMQESPQQYQPSSPYAADRSPPAYIPQSAPSIIMNSARPVLSADSICPIDLIELLVDDFFTYVHPLVPCVHEPSVREAFRQRRDIHDRPFLALLASMVGSLIAQFPRQPRNHLKAMGRANIFPHAVDFVDHCRGVVIEARGGGYLERAELGVYDAATSYFCFTMTVFLNKWRLSELYLGECNTIIRALGFYRTRPTYPPSTFGKHAYTGSESDNFVDEEIGRRVFWIIFVSVRSARTMVDFRFGEFPITPPSPTTSYPPLPLDVDDQYIHQTYIEHQPHGIVSRMSGFLLNVRVYRSLGPLISLEACYGLEHMYDAEAQKRVLRDCMRRVKQAIDNAPEEFTVWPGVGSRSPSASTQHEASSHYPQGTGVGLLRTPTTSSFAYDEERRRICYEVQKANIHVSYLSARSYLFERYWQLCEATNTTNQISNHSAQSQQQASSRSPSAFAYRSSIAVTSPASSLNSTTSSSTPAGISNEVRAERESIATDLLNVLSKLRPVHMEPNSVSFCAKVRAIASTLLPGLQNMATGGLADDGLASYYLRHFLDILMELEKIGGLEPGNVGPDDDNEEMELRRWAGLRSYQKEFASKGGLSGNETGCASLM